MDYQYHYYKSTNRMKKNIGKLHFITYQNTELSASQQTLNFCAGGGNWVQLRIKDQTEDAIISDAHKCNMICQEYGATFIVNDYVDIAAKVDADGVHLGKNDISVQEARAILGEYKIIGATANSFEDIENLANQGVDYIGLGPFRFTDTKKNLSPVLGIEGYSRIIQSCTDKNIRIPIIAIGGIIPEDFNDLFKTGIYGIALSSYIAKQDNIGLSTLEVLSELGKSQSKFFVKR
ncbi:thiamine phosphate synthase [Labilibacter sediminis]|nr:thiamine phosphate synthase [Labilibacter sediminis]